MVTWFDQVSAERDSRGAESIQANSSASANSNGKQLLKRLELFGVTLAEVEEMAKYSD